MKIKFEDYDEIVRLYECGKQQREIAEIFKCSQTNVSAILKRKNIQTRVGKKIVYNDVNYEFFKEINSEEKAYFLGLLYADGCVKTSNKTYTITLKLKSNDRLIIEKFRNIMSPSSPIKTCDNGKYSYFRIHRKEICEQLIYHGCFPVKSLILEFPTTVPDELIRHFIRGYSDGDGCIYNNKFKTYVNTIWKIVSTKQFCGKVAKILKNELNINCSQFLSSPKRKRNIITTTLSVGGNIQSEKILDWLYKDSAVYMNRKYEKYMKFKLSRNKIRLVA